jgi:hypothetical protein
MFRPLLDGRLPGDVGDARWTVTIHEHWFRVFRGEVAVRDLSSFFPLSGTLGTSDPFLIQGLIHSTLRASGLSLLPSWAITQVVVFMFGALGVAVLASRVFETTIVRVAFVLLCCTSYPVYERFVHVQLFAMLWLTWIAAALIDVAGARPRRWTLPVLLLLPPVLAMSSWYTLVLGTVALVAFGVIAVAVVPSKDVFRVGRRTSATVGAESRRWPNVLCAASSAVLWALAAWIFLEGRNVLPSPTWADVRGSPRWYDVVNVTGRGGGVWAPVYRRWFPHFGSSEQAMGFGPLLLVLLLVTVVGLAGAVRGSRWAPALSPSGKLRVVQSVAVACLLLPLAFVVFDGRFSLFRIAWTLIPGMESIRAPFRIQTVSYVAAIGVILRTIELWLPPRGSRPRRPVLLWMVALSVTAGLAIEMHRPSAGNWSSEDLVPSYLDPWVDEVRDGCDAVIVRYDPSGPFPIGSIDAVVVSTLTNVPTPQGYGRGTPVGHPGFRADPDALIGWMNDQGFDGRVCVLSGDGMTRQ